MEAEREVAAIQFGKNLERHRRRAGLSQARLAYLAILDRSEISLLERGLREPRLGTVIKLAGALEAPLSLLFEGTGWTTEHPPTDGP
jgi:transcriptional regulator with XRE-family HTH domain